MNRRINTKTCLFMFLCFFWEEEGGKKKERLIRVVVFFSLVGTAEKVFLQ